MKLKYLKGHNIFISGGTGSFGKKLVETIVKRVALPPEMGGFLRKPMEEYQ